MFDTLLNLNGAELLQKFISVLITITVGIACLRLSGKKSIAQMTLPNFIFVLILGSVLGSYLAKPEETGMMIYVAVLIVLLMIFIEIRQIKFDFIETIFTGKSKLLVSDGKINITRLKKERLTVDQLEMAVRQQGVPAIDVCKKITIEPNGSLGIELIEDAEPIKRWEFMAKMDEIVNGIESVNKKLQMNNIFDEVKEEQHDRDIDGRFD